jgi:hypothetical protein
MVEVYHNRYDRRPGMSQSFVLMRLMALMSSFVTKAEGVDHIPCNIRISGSQMANFRSGVFREA